MHLLIIYFKFIINYIININIFINHIYNINNK